MVQLTEVDHDPFTSSPTLTPVEGDPFTQQQETSMPRTGVVNFGPNYIPQIHKPEKVERSQLDADVPVYDAFSSGANVGIARVVGGAVDFTTMLLNTMGANINDPAGGSKQVNRKMTEMGLIGNVGEDEVNKVVERVAEEIGFASVALLPMGVWAKFAKNPGPIIRSWLENPAKFTATELSSATGAGTGAAVVQQQGGSEYAQIFGQLAGGTFHPITIASKTAPHAIRSFRMLMAPFSKTGAKKIAGARIKDVAKGSTEDLVKALDEPSIAPLTPAEKTLDPGLISLEKAVIRSNIVAHGKANKIAAAANKAHKAELKALAEPTKKTMDPRELFQVRIDYLKGLLRQRFDNATEIAKNKLSIFRGKLGKGEKASIIVRDEIQESLKDARIQESELYNAIPKNLKASTYNSQQTFDDILKLRAKTADPDDIPKYIREFIGDTSDEGFKVGKLGNTASIDEIRTLRSRIGHDLTEEAAKDAPNGTKIHILGKMQKALLDDIGTQVEADDAVRLAHAFSTEIHDVYSRSVVGKILGSERTGARSVAENLTLEKAAIANARLEARNNYDALIKASDNPAVVKSATIDFMAEQFYRQATDANGVIIPSAVHRYLKNNKELLDRLPEFRDSIKDAAKAQRIATARGMSAKTRAKAISDKSRSAAALYLNSSPNKVVQTILNTKDPVRFTDEIVKQLSKDKTGAAIRGFKQAWIDELIGSTEMSRMLDDNLEPLLDGGKLKSLVNKAEKSLAKVFSKAELSRLKKIADESSKIHIKKIAGEELPSTLDADPSALQDLMARLAGARMGSAVAGGSGPGALVMAGAGSRFMRTITQKIPMNKVQDVLNEAVLNGDLMKELLKTTPDLKSAIALERQLNAFLFDVLPREEEQRYEDVPYDVPEFEMETK